MEFSTRRKLQTFGIHFACYSASPKSSEKNLLHAQNVMWNRILNLVYGEATK